MTVFRGQHDTVPFKEFSIDELLQRVKQKEILLLQLGMEGEIQHEIEELGQKFNLHFATSIHFNTFDHYIEAEQKHVYVCLKVLSEDSRIPVAIDKNRLQLAQYSGIMIQYALPQLLGELSDSLRKIPHFSHYKLQEEYRTRGPPSYYFSWQVPHFGNNDPGSYSIQTTLPISRSAAHAIEPEQIYNILNILEFVDQKNLIVMRTKKHP